MALPLVDIRFKLPVDLDALLEAVSKFKGLEKSVAAREFVVAALEQELLKSALVHSELDSVGMASLLRDHPVIRGRK
jgi:hypothetical protein